MNRHNVDALKALRHLPNDPEVPVEENAFLTEAARVEVQLTSPTLVRHDEVVLRQLIEEADRRSA